MAARRSISSIRLLMISLNLFITACSKPSPKAPIPEPINTLSMSIILYNDSGDQIVSQCVVKDRVTVQQIYDCLIPHEHSKIAMDLLGSGPVIGKLGFQVANGTTWVEFVDAGMNSLCFQVREVAYIRGGAGYQSYRSDHKRLYGIDSARVAEGMVFHEKLSQICKKQQE